MHTDNSFRRLWALRPGVTYLNHGSFGPSPSEVIAERQRWFEALESEPMDLLARQLEPALHQAADRLGRFVGTRGENLVFVDNATTGMNVVAASVRLSAGDEVLTTNHEYGAVARMWQRRCSQVGARLVVGDLPHRPTSREEVVQALFEGATPRTRLIVVSHVTSPTAMILPVEDICRLARARGIPVCVDGPHALAMTPLALDALDCDYYVASCHKWLSAPLGSGFLYVHPRAQRAVQPLVVSWGGWPDEDLADWRKEFTWVGTRDPSAWLSVPAAISFLERIGLDVFRRHAHALACYARQRITTLTGRAALVPDEAAWYGTMISLPLVDESLPPPDGSDNPGRVLQRRLWQEHSIEVPIVHWQGHWLVRVSCHLYTQRDDIDRLVDALARLLAGPSQ